MKYILITISLLSILQSAKSQKSLNTKWHRLVIGGKNSFFTKTHTINDSVMVENQFGSGDSFDDSPMQISVEKVIISNEDERVITKYGDSLYAIIVFKNINEMYADVCFYSNTFKTPNEAIQYKPNEQSYFKWFTELGYKNEMAKPALPEMKKKDMIEYANYLVDKAKKLKESFKKIESTDKKNASLAAMMIMAALPGKYAETKGYSMYKSIPVIEKAMKTFAKDADIVKIIKNAKIKL